MADILLSLRRKSTVKIRAGSLFCTTLSRSGAGRAGFEVGKSRRGTSNRRTVRRGPVFLSPPLPHSPLHRLYTGISSSALAGRWCPVAKSDKTFKKDESSRMELRRIEEAGLKLSKMRAEVCPLCAGTGWKTISASSSAPEDKNRDRRVVRCDCQLRARSETLLAAARIPRRYEHCELASYTTDFPGAHHSQEFENQYATKFAKEY